MKPIHKKKAVELRKRGYSVYEIRDALDNEYTVFEIACELHMKDVLVNQVRRQHGKYA